MEVPTVNPRVVYSSPTVRGGAGKKVVKSLRKVEFCFMSVLAKSRKLGFAGKVHCLLDGIDMQQRQQ